MKTAGIICEYNPFHNGHKYHIEKTKELYGATHIVGVMSGNFTQRGDVAIIDKYKRAETALKNGVDLVIELPVAFALGSAEQFAQGAVHLLNSLGCIDILSFGSESGNIELLQETAGAIAYVSETDTFMNALRNGSSYPAALQKALEEYYEDDIVETLACPNNTLAIEYLKALSEYGSFIKPVTVKRYGAAHDSDESVSDTVVSASYLRKQITNGNDVSRLMPNADFSNTADILRLETAILSKLRTMTKAQLASVPNVMLGLENRIYKAVSVASSLPELMMLIKTKRYTMARIRRIILCSYLGITKNDLKNLPAYVHILGMNSKGKEILSNLNCPLPVNTSLMSLSKENPIAQKQAMLEERCGNLYALAMEKKIPCGLDFTAKPIILD